MSKFKGTKGEWEIGIAFQGETDNIQVKKSGKLLTVEDSDGKVIAILGRIAEDEQEANAKLIASAPELLEALKESVRLLYGTTEFEVIESYRKKVDDFEQLIKKATE